MSVRSTIFAESFSPTQKPVLIVDSAGLGKRNRAVLVGDVNGILGADPDAGIRVQVNAQKGRANVQSATRDLPLRLSR